MNNRKAGKKKKVRKKRKQCLPQRKHQMNVRPFWPVHAVPRDPDFQTNQQKAESAGRNNSQPAFIQ